MAEETIWRGTSSQYKNLGVYILCVLVVPLPWAVARYLQTKNKVYELTSERLKITQGVFSKATSTVELYRVKDIEVRQPFWYRMLGLENLQLTTSDISSPFLLFDAIPSRQVYPTNCAIKWKRSACKSASGKLISSDDLILARGKPKK